MTNNKATPPDPLAALGADTRAAHVTWTADKARLTRYRADLKRDTARLPAVRAALVAAKVAAKVADVAAFGAELHEIQERLSDAAAVEAGLVERAKQSGLAWSTTWTEWHAELEQEILGPLVAKREAFEERERVTRAEFARIVAEMPT